VGDTIYVKRPHRPIRQRCGLRRFTSTRWPAAARDLHAMFYLDELFDWSSLPVVAASLFPDREEDRFYGALLELKQLGPVSGRDR
jgi:hypothetical protein